MVAGYELRLHFDNFTMYLEFVEWDLVAPKVAAKFWRSSVYNMLYVGGDL